MLKGWENSNGRALTGAWIETEKDVIELLFIWVAPSRARGLKLGSPPTKRPAEACRALTGAWIETGISISESTGIPCRALTGAWIETPCCLK